MKTRQIIEEQLAPESQRFWDNSDIDEFARRIVEKIRDRSNLPSSGPCIVHRLIATLDSTWKENAGSDTMFNALRDRGWLREDFRDSYAAVELLGCVVHANDASHFDKAGELLVDFLSTYVVAEVLQAAAAASPCEWDRLSERDNTLGRYLQEPIAILVHEISMREYAEAK